MSAALDLPDLHTRQMNTLRRLRAAYDLNMLALRAAAPADREPRKELEQHLADTINLMQGCVYTVNHALSNAEAHERNAGVKVCGNCNGTGDRDRSKCGRCEGTGHDKHDAWCVGGERDGVCNCDAAGVRVIDDTTARAAMTSTTAKEPK